MRGSRARRRGRIRAAATILISTSLPAATRGEIAEERDAQRDLYNNYPIAPGCPQCHYARCGPTVHEWPTEAVCAAFFNAGASCTTTYRESCDNDSPYGAQYNNVPLLALGCEECRDELCDVNWSDYPTPGRGEPRRRGALQAGFNAGATCYTKYSDNCEGDNPAGAEYNDTPMWGKRLLAMRRGRRRRRHRGRHRRCGRRRLRPRPRQRQRRHRSVRPDEILRR